MRLLYFLVCILLILACKHDDYLILSPTPLDMYGQLSIQDGKVVSECGDPIQLAGMSLFWHQWGGKEFWNAKAFNQLRDDWKVQYLRGAMGIEFPDGYLDKKEASLQKMEDGIKAALETGLYFIVDWHAHDIHLDEAKVFFDYISKTYGQHPHIIYEIFNEPSGKSMDSLDETWADIKPYAQELIATIRKNDSDNIIVVGTPFWDQMTDIAAEDPILKDADGNPTTNIAYTLHFYAGGHKEEVRRRADIALSKGIALWVTECGRVGTNFGKPREAKANLPDSTSWNIWEKWMDENLISYSKWSLSTKNEESSSFYEGADPHGNWTDADLTPEGKWNRDHFRNRYAKGWNKRCN